MRRSVWWIGVAATASLVAVAALAQPGPAGTNGAGDDATMAPGARMRGQGMMGGTSMRGRMGRGGMRGRGQGVGGGMLMRRLFALDLSSDQTTRVRGIMANAQKQAIPKEADIRVKQIELRELTQQPQPNMPQIDAKVGEISNAQKDVQLIRVHAMLQARAVLTPDQLQKFLSPTWRPAAGPMPGRQGQRPAPGPIHR